ESWRMTLSTTPRTRLLTVHRSMATQSLSGASGALLKGWQRPMNGLSPNPRLQRTRAAESLQTLRGESSLLRWHPARAAEPQAVRPHFAMRLAAIPNPGATALLGTVFLIANVGAALYTAHGVQPSGGFVFLTYVSFGLAVAWWIHADCRRLGRPELVDQGWFVYLAW